MPQPAEEKKQAAKKPDAIDYLKGFGVGEALGAWGGMRLPPLFARPKGARKRGTLR